MITWWRFFCWKCGWRSRALEMTEEENSEYLNQCKCVECKLWLDSYALRGDDGN